jgi:hypothetical protein
VNIIASIHNGPMRIVPKTTVAVGAVGLAVLICVCMVGCAQPAADVDAQQVLASASAKMKTIAGLHFEYEVHEPESAGQKSGIVSIAGDVAPNGDMQATVKVYAGGFLISADFVALGATHYIKYPLNLKWTAIPAAESPVGTLNLATGTIRVLDRIIETKYVGTDKKGGVQTYHISGTVAAAEVQAIAGATDTQEPFPTDIWIGVADSLVYEVDIKGPATPTEDPAVWRSIILAALSEAPDIKAPQ